MHYVVLTTEERLFTTAEDVDFMMIDLHDARLRYQGRTLLLVVEVVLELVFLELDVDPAVGRLVE